jgi:hypothetical protein
MAEKTPRPEIEELGKLPIVELLTRLLLGEIASVPLEGRPATVLERAAVGLVVRNRATHPGWWGKDWKGVILKDKQFSCFNAGDPNLRRLLDFPNFYSVRVVEECRWLAAGIVTGAWDVDITHGANHYLTHACFKGVPDTHWAKDKRAIFTHQDKAHMFARL